MIFRFIRIHTHTLEPLPRAMPKLEYNDEMIEVTTGVSLAEMGNSYSQVLNDGITIKIRSPTAHVIQFAARFGRWLDGPKKGQPVSPEDIPGNSVSIEELDWHVDSASKPNPYYESGGAHVQTVLDLTVGDQPDVSFTECAGWDEATSSITEAFAISNIFCAASIVIANNKVQRVVAWTRTGGKGAAFYKVKVEKINHLSPFWRSVLEKDGYQVPALS